MSSFATTRWTMVLAAGSGRTDAGADRDAVGALEELCRIYWAPLYSRARREGLASADAEDAVQGFFERLLRLESLSSVDPERGRFRSFLLKSFKHYLSDQRAFDRSAKRDVRKRVPIDVSELEASLKQTSTDFSPDEAFDREWARLLLLRAMERLQAEQAKAERTAQFKLLAPCLAGRSKAQPHAEVAQKLGMREAAVRVALHRLRQRFRVLLRQEIAQTIADSQDIEDEIRYLMQVLSG